MHYTLDRCRYSRVGSYLSNHCRKKPNSGRCRREGLALQAVTNFFNSDTFWGSILLRYSQSRRSELEEGHKTHETINTTLTPESLSAFATLLQTSTRAPLLSLDMLTLRWLNQNAPRRVPHFICFPYIRQHVQIEQCLSTAMHKVFMVQVPRLRTFQKCASVTKSANCLTHDSTVS